MFSRSNRRIFALLALAVMLGVQISGGISRYFCDCTGRSELTLQEHCHGDEGPVDHAPTGHRHHDDDHDQPTQPEDGHHHHKLIKTPSDALPPIVAAAPAMDIPSVVWFEIPEMIAIPTMETQKIILPPLDDDGPPSLPIVVVRSVVFLI